MNLLNGQRLLVALWPDEASRPNLGTLANWRRSRIIPHIRLSNRVYYDFDQVKAALEAISAANQPRQKLRSTYKGTIAAAL